jgi:hypothetical protein
MIDCGTCHTLRAGNTKGISDTLTAQNGTDQSPSRPSVRGSFDAISLHFQRIHLRYPVISPKKLSPTITGNRFTIKIIQKQ